MKNKVNYSFLKILTGSDMSRRRLPLMYVNSFKDGPVIWLTACGHGDEVGGVIVIQEIFKWIKKNILLKGAIYKLNFSFIIAFFYCIEFLFEHLL